MFLPRAFPAPPASPALLRERWQLEKRPKRAVSEEGDKI